MVKLVNRARMSTSTTGTGTITLGSAENGYQSFDDAGVPDGDVVRYVIEDGSNWEVGTGTYTASGTTLTRTVTESSNSDAAINLSGNAVVFIGPAAQDFSPTITLAGDASGSVTLTDLEDATLTVTVADDSHNHTIANVDNLQTNLDAKLDKSGGTMTGNLILNADPTTALGAATKEYVDTIAAAGVHYHDPVRVEQEGNLTATYDNGTAGVGATLTNSGTQAALVIDGVTMVLNDRVLVYEQTNAFENGVYTVTDVGSASTNWVLTRATDADSYAPSDPDSLGKGDAFFVQEGNAGAGELYVMNTDGAITFGTTAITFTQIQATAVYSGGTDITLSGTTFNLDSTISADTTGNAATATALETARTIGGVSFDGTANIDLAGVNTTGNQDTSGNAATATAWETARTITLSGDVSGTATGVDGSGNVSITTTVADDSHDHTIANVDGLQTALDAKAPTASPTFSGTVTFPAGQTFDGRDVSADGAKLDGIESGATADQTKADIDALGIAASTASTLATARTISLAGDVSGSTSFDGSGNVSITATVADDSHNHVISNIDGLQSALDAGFVSASASNDTITFTTAGGTTSSVSISDAVLSTEQVQDIVGGMVSGNTESGISVTYDDAGNSLDFNVNDPTITLTGAVTGSATMTNLGNVSIATTATADPTLTLSGDASGSATFTNLGNATLTVTVADDSHNHVISNIDGLQSALDGKQAAGTYNTIIGTDSDINTSGSTIIDNIFVTDGVITSMGTRTLTAADIGALSTSGKAADSNLLDGLDLSTGRNNVANRVMRTNSSGYAEFGWINTTSGDTTGGLSRIYVDTGDNYIRKCTLSHLASQGGFLTSSASPTTFSVGKLYADSRSERVREDTSTTGTINVYLTHYGSSTDPDSVVWLTADQTADRTIKFWWDTAQIDTSIAHTVTVLLTNGTTPYKMSAYYNYADATFSGGSASVPFRFPAFVKWQGATQPAAGNADSIDAYTYTFLFKSNGSFDVIGSGPNQFA